LAGQRTRQKKKRLHPGVFDRDVSRFQKAKEKTIQRRKGGLVWGMQTNLGIPHTSQKSKGKPICCMP